MLSVDSSLAVSLAILDGSGGIESVNEGWKRFGQRNGLRASRFGVGLNYLECCKSTDAETQQALAQIRALLAGEVDLVSLAYRCDSPTEKRVFVLIGAPLPSEPGRAFALLHLNVSAMVGSTSAMEMASSVERSTSDALADHLAKMPASRIAMLTKQAAALSEKERTVLNLLRSGRTNKEIATLLSRSPNTIKIHVSRVLKKLELRSRTEAALVAFQFENSK
jgi:DNA-binding NarL/FixJ family response regulator